jgi:membrane protease YdiL (CAAX protease family)
VFPEPIDPSPLPPPLARLGRVIALLEVVVCSDYPTQLALGATFAALGYGPIGRDGHLQIAYVVGLSLVDAVVLVGLVLLFLHAHGERPRDVLFGGRPALVEAAHGAPLILAALAIGIGVLVSIQLIAPSLHTVANNPMQELLRRPRDAWLFALVVIVAGGVREEIQRAFLLHRFEVWLGGARTGLVVTSVAFGAGHFLQGVDAMITTGLLGAFWGGIYLRRRSAVAPMVSHAGFDLAQILQFLAVGR